MEAVRARGTQRKSEGKRGIREALGVKGTEAKAGLVVPQERKQKLSAVFTKAPKALRHRMPSDLEGMQTKRNGKVLRMAVLNSEGEPCGSTPQVLPRVQYSGDPSVPGDSPSESQAVVHRYSGLSWLQELNSQDHLSTTLWDRKAGVGGTVLI